MRSSSLRLSPAFIAGLAGLAGVVAACSSAPRANHSGDGGGGEGQGGQGGAVQSSAGPGDLGGAGGAGGVGGQGGAPECAVSNDCPGTDTECQARQCSGGICGFFYTASLTPIAQQTPGNCSISVCDGAGSIIEQPDSNDVLDDSSQCTVESCQGGAPSHAPLPLGSACPGGVCDAAGQCVECNLAADCAGQDSYCGKRACTAGVCSADNLPSGTPLPPQDQTFYDCLTKQCDGQGGVITADDINDALPDAYDCTQNLCQNGGYVYPPSPAGAPCNESFGKVCDGQGACVECVTDMHCGNWYCAANKCTQCKADADCASWQSCQIGLCNADEAPGISTYDGALARPEAMVVDSAGNIYIAGWFQGTIDFGGGPFTSNGRDIFVLKLNALRNHVWSKQFGGAGDQYARGIALDGPNRIALIGDFDGTLSFGGQSFNAADRDVFVTKLSAAAGSHVWSRHMDSMGDAEGRAIAVDAAGQVIIAGGFDGQISLGGPTLIEENGMPNTGRDAFLALLDPNGSQLWSQRFGESTVGTPLGDQIATDIAIGENGAIWALIDYESSIDVGLGARSSPGGGADLAKFSPMGAPLDDEFAPINGRLAIVPTNFDMVIASPEAVRRLNKNTGKVWETYLGFMGVRRNVDVTVDSMGNSIVTMGFNATTNAFGRTFTSAGDFDVLVVSIAADGRHTYSGAFGGPGDEEGTAVGVASSGAALVAGFYTGPFMIGGQTLTPTGPQSVFLASFGP